MRISSISTWICLQTLVSAHLKPPPNPNGEQLFINNNGVTIHYRKYGSGPYLIFQHGFPDRETTWNDFQVPLFSKHYTVITPTLRGFPPSAIPPNVADYTFANYTSDLLAILDHENAPSATLIGHDFGGGIVQSFSHTYPDKVAALIVVNAPILPTFISLIEYDKEEQEYAKYTIPYYTYEPGQPKNISKLVEWIRNDTYRAEIAAYLDSSPIYGMLDFYKNNYPGPPYGQNLTAALNITKESWTQKVPSMLLWGEEDPYFSPKLIDGLEGWFEFGLRLVTVPRAGHWVFRDQWQRANEEIWSFLRIAGGIEGSFV
ncbi:putative hydrolase [Lophiotrema nucula]|uniref:Putative hydrolase n=1 Tax=Lophiotrema nucula TaxID=690887 RepID=A0A6A5ZW11_9PLEO|nr:putative hydrolase [Lophiotrema nucula]